MKLKIKKTQFAYLQIGRNNYLCGENGSLKHFGLKILIIIIGIPKIPTTVQNLSYLGGRG
jgi:hypothetical protein